MGRKTGKTNTGSQPTIEVVATTVEGTAAALGTAVPLAAGSEAKLVVVVPHIVPYPIEPGAPVESTAVFVKQYEDIVAELGGNARIEIVVCRRLEDLVDKVVERDATVVIGGPVGRWLTSPEERFANRLSRRGRRVILVSSGPNTTQRRMAPSVAAALVLVLACAASAVAQPPDPPPPVQYGGFVDIGDLYTSSSPANHLFRNRGTTPRVNELDVNMAAAYVRKSASESSRLGFEATAQTGEDTKIFGFSATAPNIGNADVLLHLGPSNVSYLAPVGNGLTIQGGIFSSLIGYDSLYAKDNFNYTRPWGADYTPYLMLGVNAAYPVTPRLTVTGILVNGYWHLANANNVPSAGAQIAYKATDTVAMKQTVLYGPHQTATSLEFWRVLSDTIVERKTSRLTTAFEYQFSTERVDVAGGTRAYWMSVQGPVHWPVAGPVSATLRPEISWDSDGRWTGFPQTVKALTATLEYRAPFRAAQAIVRGEYRVDDSRGSGGGFFDDGEGQLTPTQNLFVLGVIVTFDGTIRQ
jgi:hypothetical protein